MRSFAGRVDRFFQYLLNFDDAFIYELVDKPDGELFPNSQLASAQGIVSLAISLADVEMILRLFGNVTDEAIREKNKLFFTYVEK